MGQAEVQTLARVESGELPLTGKVAYPLLRLWTKPLLLSGKLSGCSDESFEAVHLEGPFDELGPDAFYAAFGLDPNNENHVVNQELDPLGFWAEISEWHKNWVKGHDETTWIERLLNLLTDHYAVVLGRDSWTADPYHPVYIVGLTSDKQLVGVRSRVCWA